MAEAEGLGPGGRPPAARRWPRGVRVTLAVLTGVLVTALAAWPLMAAHQRGQVHVLLDAAALACDDAAVGDESLSASGSDVTLPVAEITEDMRCLLRVRVENRGLTTARVDRLSVPVVGPAGGFNVESPHLPMDGVEPVPDEVDAVFTLDRPREIGAESAAELEVELVYRPDGCTPDGAIFHFVDAPTTSVSVLGIRGERSVVGHSFGFRGSEVSDCGGELPR